MSAGPVRIDKLVELAIAGEELPLALLLEVLAPVKELRRLAKEYGLTPKGGFRIDKAPAHVLAPMLAALKDAKQLDAVVRALQPAVAESVPANRAAGRKAEAEPDPALAEVTARAGKLAEELAKAQAAGDRQRTRESALRQRLEEAEGEIARLRSQLSERRADRLQPAKPARDDLTARVHELEQDLEARDAADEALRRQVAADRRRIRELEIAKAELEALLPRGKRKPKAEPAAVTAAPEKRIRLPYFRASFYKSLAVMDQRSVAQAFEAVWIYCTHGPSYPALQVKAIGGQETWSMRAALALRVYFKPREDGDIDVIEVANREDQPTMLRRLKDR